MSFTQKLLTYAGTLPFFGVTLLLLIGVKELPVVGSLETLLSSYAVVIAAFMMGSSWGSNFHLSTPNKTPVALVSNGLALLLWLGVLLVSGPGLFLLLAVLFVAILWMDRMQAQDGSITPEYWFHRRWVTGVVVLLLLMVAGILDFSA